MELNYLLIDVFTDRPFGGSRLYVFPDGDRVSGSLMQDLAMELGAGETAFIIPSGEEDGTVRSGLRVFTPAAEIPFGGHSLLGATFALDHLGIRTVVNEAEKAGGILDSHPFTWDLETGSYRVLTRHENGVRLYGLEQDDPVFMGQYFHRDKVARTLGLAEENIAITGLPCEIISTGLPTHIVPLDSLETMGRINLRRRDADSIAADLGFGDLFVFTCETRGEDVTVHCRMFAPHFGIPEDAASGAATGALVAYLIKHRLVKAGPRVRIISEQGLELGRPSRIFAEAEIVGGQAASILVGGQCVHVGSGSINIP